MIRATPPSVCAIVEAHSGSLLAAVEAQSHPPAHVVPFEEPLQHGLRSPRSVHSDWLWLLDGTVIPEPTALEALVGGLGRTAGLPRPSILTGSVVSASGAIDAAWAPWYRGAPTEVAMSAVERRLVPVRATAGALLVRRDLAAPGPRTDLEPGPTLFEWTARLLRAEAGYWVAGSHGRLVPGAAAPTAGSRTARALVFGGAFRGAERVKVALDLLGGHRSARAQAIG